jgi:hypothetical protein
VPKEQPPQPPRKQQRSHPRFELLASVEVHQDEETLILPARNLSIGGIFLGADGHDLARLKVGSVVEILVFNGTDENHPPLRASAKVVRHDKEGVGFKWQETPDTKKAISSLLDAIRPWTAPKP